MCGALTEFIHGINNYKIKYPEILQHCVNDKSILSVINSS